MWHASFVSNGFAYESAGLVRGEDGALIVLASEGGAPKLETEETDSWRCGRLERNP